MLTPLRVSRGYSPAEFAYFPEEVRRRALRGPMADALVEVGLVKVSTETPTITFPQGRIIETLTVFVDPTMAHVEEAAHSKRTASIAINDFDREMLNMREKELAARERELAQNIQELQNAQREIREQRQQIVSEFLGYDECAGRR